MFLLEGKIFAADLGKAGQMEGNAVLEELKITASQNTGPSFLVQTQANEATLIVQFFLLASADWLQYKPRA